VNITQRQLKRRVQEWQEYLPLLGVAHWQISLEIVEAPDGNPGSNACVRPHEDYDYAHMEFRQAFLEEQDSWDEIDQVIIHEILHMVFRDFDNVHESIRLHLASPVAQVWYNQVNHELENMIERLAQAMWALYNAEVVS
jgi:hypothetical protein